MKMFLVFLLVFISSIGFACDGCNISTGLVNADPVNYVSVKYRNAIYQGVETPFQRHTKDGGALTETYLSYELTAKYFVYNQFYPSNDRWYSSTDEAAIRAWRHQFGNECFHQRPFLLQDHQSRNRDLQATAKRVVTVLQGSD